MKKIKAIYINITFLFIIEILFSLIIFKSLSLTSIFYILLFAFIGGSLITLISNVFNNKISKILNYIILSLITFIFLAQLIYFNFYYEFFSIASLFSGPGQVVHFLNSIFNEIIENWYFIILLLLPLVLLILFYKKVEVIRSKQVVYNLFILIISIVVLFLSFIFNKNTLYSPENLFYNTYYPIKTVKTFGLVPGMSIDLKRYIFGINENIISSSTLIKDYSVADYNVIKIDFDNLDSSSKDLEEINSYIQNTPPTSKNKYTGMFSGKNLIYIVAESFSPIAIDKDLTPTLYKLANEGFNFNNFYTPIYYISTSDGEYTSLLSLLPTEGDWSLPNSYNKYFPYSYGNMMKKYGYKTYAYHDGLYKFFSRNLSHPNLGYTYESCGNGLQDKMNCNNWPESDLEMVDVTFDDYKNDANFMTYYVTVSGHLDYTFDSNDMSYKNKDDVKDLNYSDEMKAYLAANIELDKALAKLIEKLEEKGILDDTVIALNADHYPYGLTTGQMNEKENNIKDEKFDTQKNTFILWNSEMKEPVTVDKYASNLDVLPTIYNLFGIKYDSRLIVGKDILSDADNTVIFSDRSWITSKGKYNALTNKFTPFSKVSNTYVDEINLEIYNKFTVSRLILKNNYYEKIKEVFK